MTNQELITTLRGTLKIWLDSGVINIADVETIVMDFTGQLECTDTQQPPCILFALRQVLTNEHLSANDEDDILEEYSKRINTPVEKSHEKERGIAFEIVETLMANYHSLSLKSLEAVLKELKSRIS